MSIVERAIEAAKGRKTGAEPVRNVPVGVPRHEHHAINDEPVNFSALATRGALVSDSRDRAVLDQFRNLKRPLMQSCFGPLAPPGANVVMITSVLQGAGKTFAALNLAHVLAQEKDRDVLLVDMDNARMNLTAHLGLENRPGVFDVLSDSTLSLDDVTCKTDLARLFVIGSGNRFPDSLELLNSSRGQKLFRALGSQDRSRAVILDGPPLLATPDGPAISGLAGQVLLIVEAGATTRNSLAKALETLDRTKPIGLILNKAPAHFKFQGYAGYGYAPAGR